MIKRNHTYSVGDTEYSMEGYKLICKTAGTTAPTPINMGGGQTITDGTVEWEVTLGEDAMPSEITESIVYTPSTINEWSILNFVAPANGFVGIFIAPQANGNSIVKLQQGIGDDFDYRGLSVSSTSQKSDSRVIGCYMPVSKGEVIRLASLYMNSAGLCVCRFVYSVGEAKRLGLI